MANEEQLSILKQGSKSWNEWRTENFSVGVDLSGAYLRVAHLFEADLNRANLQGADLAGANLVSTNLQSANLRNTNLQAADLTQARLEEAVLVQANLRGAILIRANLLRADLLDVDLRGADLQEADLSFASLVQADFSKVSTGALVHMGARDSHEGRLSSPFSGKRRVPAFLSKPRSSQANLRGVKLQSTDLTSACFQDANLSGMDLRGARLVHGDFRGANLMGANLHGVNLSDANLEGADLSGAILNQANFNGAVLGKTIVFRSDFSEVHIGNTHILDTDISQAKGLVNVVHTGPSTLGTDTLFRSRGKIPEVFLRGCGLSDWEIENVKLYNPDLSNTEVNSILYRIYDLHATKAVQISPLFISYSHSDTDFVDKIGDQLNRKGVRYWRDIHEMKSGRMERQIDRAIELNPTVLIILSKHSLMSDWVEHEVRKARQIEKKLKRDVLCPVTLDGSWKKKKNAPWPKRIMEQIMEYNILDFSEWQDDHKFGEMFRRLIDGLELFYKG